ncbi:hypothetical protein [Chitiniphilus eburneus]|uniref:Uncharacterized protein n=2 Tax=Chitiniphilus eburneus TaxID=2571148 RepID=A0A4U0QRN7_9NEIS|nr:hypothetical protein [Chitiniphilus eburneus]TJZ78894.1 hypothetical protein FAZ21_01000 [Chitiniphilus eburneus]
MKIKQMHIVPLSRQALVILNELQAISESKQCVLPTARNGEGASHLQTTTFIRALRQIGYARGELTFHGSGQWL